MARSDRAFLVSSFAGALLLTLCSTSALAESPKRGGVFRVPAPEATSLDPHQVTGFSTHVYASLVHGHLVRFPAGPESKGSGDLRILPDLAEKWEWTSPTTVIFTLRRGVKFHRKPPVNGREVTAEDVKYSLERFRAKSALRSRLEAVQSIDVLDTHRVRLVLSEPFAPLLNHLATPASCAIMPREIVYEMFFTGSPRNRSRVADPELDRLLIAQRRELDPTRRREIIHEIQRYLADKVYYVYLPMWPRYIAHPPYVKGFKHIDGFGLGTRLMYVWLDR